MKRLHRCDWRRALTETYSNCAQTHFSGGVLSPFVFLLSAIARAPNLTDIGSMALRKGPQRFCLHHHVSCHSLMLMCRKSPWWRSCECCNNFLSSFWLPLLAQLKQHGCHVSCSLIGSSHKLGAYKYTDSVRTRLEYKLVDTECAQVSTRLE